MSSIQKSKLELSKCKYVLKVTQLLNTLSRSQGMLADPKKPFSFDYVVLGIK